MGERELMAWLADHLHGTKWADVFPELRPVAWEDDGIVEYEQKYIDRETFWATVAKHAAL